MNYIGSNTYVNVNNGNSSNLYLDIIKRASPYYISYINPTDYGNEMTIQGSGHFISVSQSAVSTGRDSYLISVTIDGSEVISYLFSNKYNMSIVNSDFLFASGESLYYLNSYTGTSYSNATNLKTYLFNQISISNIIHCNYVSSKIESITTPTYEGNDSSLVIADPSLLTFENSIKIRGQKPCYILHSDPIEVS